MKISLNDLFEELEEDCPNCENKGVTGCHLCKDGRVLTEAGWKLICVIKRQLWPDKEGGWTDPPW